MTAASTEAQALIDLAKKQGKILSVYQNRRFDSDFRTLQKVIQQGLLGELLSFEAHYHRYKPELNPKKWKETPSPANGILYDLGAHLIDQAITLFGVPDNVIGEVFTQRANSEIDDAFDVKMAYGKLRVHLKSSLLVREDVPRYIVHGTKGSFIKYGIDVQEDSLKAGILPTDTNFGKEDEKIWGILNIEINGLNFRGKIESYAGNYGLLFENLYEAIAEGKPLIVKPEEVLEQIKIIESIERD
jgi:scyllo-inositol 2-dehydrogenase (NADP+)